MPFDKLTALNERWAVTYQYHENDEAFYVKTTYFECESIGEALSEASKYLDYLMEKYHWSDYHVTSINYVPELH
jgi:hypothetical protein